MTFKAHLWIADPNPGVDQAVCYFCDAFKSTDNEKTDCLSGAWRATVSVKEVRDFTEYKWGKPRHPSVDNKTPGIKFDDGKPRLELIAPEWLFAPAIVLTFGAQKYTDRNWEKGMKWSRCFGAMMRHMWAWWGGKGPTTISFLFGPLDSETGFSHLWHAACCLMFLIAYEERKTGEDDRFAA